MLLKIQHNNGRVLALCGAGLSAPSGLGTLKGSGGMWRKHNIVKLATEDAFMRDAGLVVSVFLFSLARTWCRGKGI